VPAEDARPLEEIEAATRKEEARNRRAGLTEAPVPLSAHLLAQPSAKVERLHQHT